MIKLYQFKGQFGLPNPCPFCMALDTFLRMCDLDYTSVTEIDMKMSPRANLPILDIAGKVVADSNQGMRYIEQQYCIDLEASLSKQARHIAEALSQAFEKKFYWALLYSRWLDANLWAANKEVWFQELPWGLRDIRAQLAREQVRKAFVRQGLEKKSAQVIYSDGRVVLAQTIEQLGKKEFLMGSQPTKADAVAYAFIANTLYTPIDSPLKQFALGQENIQRYCARMYDKYYANTTFVNSTYLNTALPNDDLLIVN